MMVVVLLMIFLCIGNCNSTSLQIFLAKVSLFELFIQNLCKSNENISNAGKNFTVFWNYKGNILKWKNVSRRKWLIFVITPSVSWLLDLCKSFKLLGTQSSHLTYGINLLLPWGQETRWSIDGNLLKFLGQ